MSLALMKACVLALAYTDQFAFPLTTQEVRRRLVGFKASEAEVLSALESLAAKKVVVRDGQYWRLRVGRANVQLRQARDKLSTARWQEVAKLEKTIGWIPWVRGLAVTGSLAMNNLRSHSDIDLMVVTAPRRLWLTRVLVSLFSLVAGRRRTWRGSEADSWCFNLWLEETALSLPDYKRNLYTAYEICQAKWVMDREQLRAKFYEHNSWVRSILPQYFQDCFGKKDYLHKKGCLKKNDDDEISGDGGETGGEMASSTGGEIGDQTGGEKKHFSQTPVLGWLEKWLGFLKWLGVLKWPGRQVLNILEWLVYQVQIIYMYPHITSEIVGGDHAYFHPRPTQDIIYRRWQASLLQAILEQSQKVVLVTGVFDLLHQEHRNFLARAKKAGDLLVVGVESDQRVRQLKGWGRPVQSQGERRWQLAQLSVVDWAFVLPKKFSQPEQHLKLLRQLQPDVLAVSAHTSYLAEKRELMAQVGGEVRVVYEHQPGVSTTALLEFGTSATRSCGNFA